MLVTENCIEKGEVMNFPTLKNEYTLKDFDVAVNHTCGTLEESIVQISILNYFNEYPEKLLNHPGMKELDYTVDDIKKMLDVGKSGCITEFY